MSSECNNISRSERLSEMIRSQMEQDRSHRPRVTPPRRQNKRSLLPVQEEITPEDRDTLVAWVYDVFSTQPSWPLDLIFPSCITLVDRFLSVCSIKKTQLQLLGVVCSILAFKKAAEKDEDATVSWQTVEDVMRECTDGAVTQKEVRAWELLVLSKLRWDLNTITTNEYLEVFKGQYHMKEDPQRCLSTARQICAFCLRDLRLTRRHPTHLRALSAWLIASEQRDRETSEETSECISETDSYLHNNLPETPPGSPFKVTSTSTPKYRRPLQERSRNAACCRRLEEVQEKSPSNKENDDSAIGLCVTSELPSSESSGSNNSSPDSGTGDSTSSSRRLEDKLKIENIEEELEKVALE